MGHLRPRARPRREGERDTQPDGDLRRRLPAAAGRWASVATSRGSTCPSTWCAARAARSPAAIAVEVVPRAGGAAKRLVTLDHAGHAVLTEGSPTRSGNSSPRRCCPRRTGNAHAGHVDAASRASADARASSSGALDREGAAEPREDARRPVQRDHPHPQERPASAASAQRGRGSPPGRLDWEVEEHLDLPRPGHPRERAGNMGPRRSRPAAATAEPRRSTDSPHPVDPEGAQVVTRVVVGGEVPAPGVDDEAVWAELPAYSSPENDW